MKKLPEGQLFSWRAVFDAIPDLLGHLPTTLGLTLAGAFFGLILALVFAIVKINRPKVLYPIQAVFVSFLRGTPILVQLMLTYYGIPLFLKFLKLKYGFDWNINAIPASVFAVTAFAFNEAAYTSETIRAAIQAVNVGEIEAARSLGMTSFQVYRRVIIPNAAVIATPTLINSLIGLTKGTSLAFNAGIVEIFAQAQILGGSDYRYFERYISVALVYWIISIIIEQIGRLIEKKMTIDTPKIKPRYDNRRHSLMIKITKLTKAFSGQKVLDGLDVAIKKGEVLALVGASGAGKSTFLRSLNYLEQADYGSIAIDDFKVDFQNITKEEVLELRRKLAMVFQQFNLFERRTALENVKEGLKIVKKLSDVEATKIAKEELAKVGLSDRENHYPRHLSGGQKQRVALARALAMKPDVLLLDEPTSALDPELVGEVEKSIADAAKAGQTMILVSHDMNFVYQVADKVLFLDKGRILEAGRPEEIFKHPKEARTKEFFANYSKTYI